MLSGGGMVRARGKGRLANHLVSGSEGAAVQW